MVHFWLEIQFGLLNNPTKWEENIVWSNRTHGSRVAAKLALEASERAKYAAALSPTSDEGGALVVDELCAALSFRCR